MIIKIILIIILFFMALVNELLVSENEKLKKHIKTLENKNE